MHFKIGVDSICHMMESRVFCHDGDADMIDSGRRIATSRNVGKKGSRGLRLTCSNALAAR